MIEMEIYDGKNEEGEIHYGMMGTKTEQGMVTRMSWTSVTSRRRECLQCLLRQKGELKLQTRMTMSGH